MNSFVNSLLEIVLSWVQGIINDIWTIFGGGSGSFFEWIGRHWLPLVCILVIGGVTADLLFYILRWRPQRVWFYKLDRLLRRSEYREEEAAFAAGYSAGIDSFHLDEDPLISQYLNDPDNRLEQYDASAVSQNPETELNAAENASLHVRHHRRSERHIKRSARWNRKVYNSEEEDYGYIYPAPPVRERDAFHDAVYPSADHNNWGQNQNANRN